MRVQRSEQLASHVQRFPQDRFCRGKSILVGHHESQVVQERRDLWVDAIKAFCRNKRLSIHRLRLRVFALTVKGCRQVAKSLGGWSACGQSQPVINRQ